MDVRYECSDMFLPLKTTAGVLVSIIKIADMVAGNQERLKDLQGKMNRTLCREALSRVASI
ncbi:hypothetical protein CPB84DRAFT_1774659, partial [Gymnopilus junonius]